MTCSLSPALAAVRALPGVRRAWPGADCTLSFEYTDQAGLLRAGKAAADGSLEFLPYGQDAALPQLTPSLASAETRLLVHRAGKRAVVLAPSGVTKHLKKSKVGAVATATEAVGSVAHASGFGTARVDATAKQSVTFSVLPGSTLFDLADEALPAWQQFAVLWPEFLAQAQESLEAAGQLSGRLGEFIPPVHGPSQEVGVLSQWLGHVKDHGSLSQLPGVPEDAFDRLRAQAEHTASQLSDVQRETPHGLLHRDLHDKQLLWDGSSLGILDVDTTAIGETALDLANLLAHIELRHTQGLITASTAQAVETMLREVAAQLAVPTGRLATYEQAARIRIACVYSFRPSAATWLPRWIDKVLTHPSN